MTRGSAVLDVTGLTKSFGAVCAVDGLTFQVDPGSVTGFLGPNGAGKTTTLRMLLGLVAPDDGTATIGGLPYRDLDEPARRVGAALDQSSFHPARTGRDHLRVLASQAGVARDRVDEVLDLVGLAGAGRRRVGGYSLGMRQRLALAGALLGDPDVLVLDEPANGLDPEGIRWLRGLLRGLAGDGRTLLVSSHVLSEMQQLVDRVVIVHRGQLVAQGPLAELQGHRAVTVRSPEISRLREDLTQAGIHTEPADDPTGLRAVGADPADVGRIAHRTGIELWELAGEPTTLEDTFLALTNGDTTVPQPTSTRGKAP